MKIRTQNSIGTGYYTIDDIRSFFLNLKQININYKHTLDELNEIETSIHRATNNMILAYESILSTLEPNTKSYETIRNGIKNLKSLKHESKI